jgi:predicted RND superfamily exporter protein
MVMGSSNLDNMPVVRDPRDFDRQTGNILERLVFNNRLLFIFLCVLLTGFFGYQSSKLVVNAAFDKVIPQHHPYIKNYFENRDKLGALGNSVRVVVENKSGDMFDKKFIETTRKINDGIFLLPGVDRSWMRSIWMSAVRWTEVTEEGFRGGTVISERYDGSPDALAELKRNINTAGLVGSLVGTDYKSIMIVVPLLDNDPRTGKRLDYGEFSRQLERDIRAKYETASGSSQNGPDVKIHIVGFAKLSGDLIDGLNQVMTYFAVAAAVAAIILFLYTRCVRSTILVIACSIVAVVWQVGLLSAFKFELDPYSILVPFLVFAIGVSHGAQKMNGIMQDIGRGTHKYVGARYTFRRLFLAGLTALIADAVGFAVLMIIDIPVIKDLAVTASMGVAVLIFTNLLLLPALLSYVGVSQSAARRSLAEDNAESSGRGWGKVWGVLDQFTERRWAIGALLASTLLTVGAGIVALNLKIGDLDPGAPELRADSRYNVDLGYINRSYRLSGDQFVVIVKTPDEGCSKYETLTETGRLSARLMELPGVQQTFALSGNVTNTVSGLAEGNPKWLTISRNKELIGGAVHWILTDNPEVADKACSVIPIVAYLKDHKSDTLRQVVKEVEQFAKEHNNKDLTFLLAAGPAGIEAVTNIVVRDSILLMYLSVYGAVALLCFVTFRSWRAVVVALVPLVMTSILCKALMVMLGIGLKVATLPVIALGVGIGVDYALYLLSVQLAQQRAGLPLRVAYKNAVAFTGKVVALVGITLAAGVITWAWSPIKFQADMGILLTFMFLWNMVGALILVPALSHFLLRTPAAAPAAVTPANAALAKARHA